MSRNYDYLSTTGMGRGYAGTEHRHNSEGSNYFPRAGSAAAVEGTYGNVQVGEASEAPGAVDQPDDRKENPEIAQA